MSRPKPDKCQLSPDAPPRARRVGSVDAPLQDGGPIMPRSQPELLLRIRHFVRVPATHLEACSRP